MRLRCFEVIVQPAVLQGRTTGEQAEFIRKALRDELSSDGIDALQKNGRFGPLRDLFPQQAEEWARQAGVPADQCLAFRFDRPNGLRAEVVMQRNGDRFRIVRVNNANQPAHPAPQ